VLADLGLIENRDHAFHTTCKDLDDSSIRELRKGFPTEEEVSKRVTEAMANCGSYPRMTAEEASERLKEIAAEIGVEDDSRRDPSE